MRNTLLKYYKRTLRQPADIVTYTTALGLCMNAKIIVRSSRYIQSHLLRYNIKALITRAHNEII